MPRKDAVTELKTAVRELHRNGIEVILDVVYNHTAEGGEGGTTFSLKALDSRYYIKHGCRARTSQVVVIRSTLLTSQHWTVMDTLRYWVARIPNWWLPLWFGSNTGGAKVITTTLKLLSSKPLLKDPVLKETKLIAEPWDIGPNGCIKWVISHSVGMSVTTSSETSLTFWRGDQGYLKELQLAWWDLATSTAPRIGRTNSPSTTSYHDGFTMQDLVSYKHKHNEEWWEQSWWTWWQPLR